MPRRRGPGPGREQEQEPRALPRVLSSAWAELASSGCRPQNTAAWVPRQTGMPATSTKERSQAGGSPRAKGGGEGSAVLEGKGHPV